MADREPDFTALLNRACAGDEAALERVLVLATPSVRASIEQEIQPRWKPYLATDDILQETYIDACASLRCFTPEGEKAIVRWLKRIALNNITDAIRAVSRPGLVDPRRAPRYLTGFGPHLTLLMTVAGTRPSLNAPRSCTEAEAKAALAEHLAGLPEHERFVIGQLFFEGRSAADLSTELGRTVGAVYLIRNRAIRKLRVMFGLDATSLEEMA